MHTFLMELSIKATWYNDPPIEETGVGLYNLYMSQIQLSNLR